MKRSTKQYLFDIFESIERLEGLMQAKTELDLKTQLMLLWAVERGLGIIGEAASQIRKREPGIMISNLGEIVRFRNFIIHAYFEMESKTIFTILHDDLPLLKTEVKALLDAG